MCGVGVRGKIRSTKSYEFARLFFRYLAEIFAQVFAPHAHYDCFNAGTAEGKACAACEHRFARKSTWWSWKKTIDGWGYGEGHVL